MTRGVRPYGAELLAAFSMFLRGLCKTAGIRTLILAIVIYNETALNVKWRFEIR